MSESEKHEVDKSGFPSGPWMTEPDKVQWTDPATGYACLIVRNTSGALCGYVGVAEGHPHFGKHYDDVGEVEVHGGLTYSDFCSGHICHVPEPGQPERVWWLGFDCGHCWDLIPDMDRSYRMSGNECIYRDVEYVRNHCTALASQLRAVA